VHLDQASHESETDSKSRLRFGRATGQTREQGKQLRQRLDRDPFSVVPDPELDRCVGAPHAELDPAARLRVLDRVAQQVAEHLHQARAISLDKHGLGRAVDAQLVLVFHERRLDRLDGPADDRAHLQAFHVEIDRAAGDPRDIEQVVDQLGEVQHLTLDDLAGPGDRGRIGRCSRHHLDRVADRRERIAQARARVSPGTRPCAGRPP
jgi:hypothetical protein